MKLFYALAAALLLNACVSSPETAVANDRSAGASADAISAPPPRLTVLAAPAPTPTPRLSTTSPPPSAPTSATASYPLAKAQPPAGSLASREDVQAFIRKMVAKHKFDQQELQTLFGRARARSDIIALISRPAEAKPWYAYRKIFLTPQRIQGGVAFWRTHEEVLQRAEEFYGVPAEIIVAIIGVETTYGANMGKHRVLEALATLAFDYPRRSVFFTKELESYLLLTRREGIDSLALKGSYAGAMGLGQFMPSSYQLYAVDFDGDQRRDLLQNPEDAIGSVANYLSKHHWSRGGLIATPAQVSGQQYQALITKKLTRLTRDMRNFQQRGVIPQTSVSDQQLAILLELEGSNGLEYWLGFNNFYVITRYNRSPLYAMAVYQLSQKIRERYKAD